LYLVEGNIHIGARIDLDGIAHGIHTNKQRGVCSGPTACQKRPINSQNKPKNSKKTPTNSKKRPINS